MEFNPSQKLGNLLVRVRSNNELKKILANINWLFFDKLVQMSLALVVGVWVVRYLGPEKYGALSYAIAFVALFAFIAKLGMDEIAVREFVSYPEKKGKIFGTSVILRFFAALAAVVCATVAIYFVKHGDTQTFWLTFIISLSFVFQISDIIDFWFQSQIKSKYTVMVRSGVSITVALIKIVLVLTKAPLIDFAAVILLESLLVSVGFYFFFLQQKTADLKLKIDLSVAKQILKDSWPLILASVAVAVYMKIDQVMIGSMLGDKPLGIYSVAVTLSEIWYFFPVVVCASVFPAIIYSKKISQELYHKRLQMLFDTMVWVAIIIAALITIFSSSIISILFGKAFIQASTVLSIYVWAGVFVFMGVVSSKYWVAENLTKISLYITFVGAIANVLLNLWLIPRMGIVGSALATLISYGLTGSILIVFFKRARIIFLMQIKSLNIFRIFNYLLN